jgi:hypothetical protein
VVKMSERYWISGAQLGMLKADVLTEEELENIVDKQFIGNIPMGVNEKYCEIVIRTKVLTKDELKKYHTWKGEE